MTSVTPLPAAVSRDDTVVIRLAVAQDAPALERLALIDSAPRLLAGTVVVAEVDGELLAARSVEDGRAVADPFRRTAHLTALLATRAQLLPGAHPVRTIGRGLLGRRPGVLATLR